MTKNEILEKLQEIIREAVDNDEVVLSYETTAADVEGWDSLSQVLIVGEIRNEFGVKLTSTEVMSLENVGKLVEAIEVKM
jgi:acyl carrier protein